MLRERLRIDFDPGQLQISLSSLDMSIQNANPFRDSRVQYSSGSLRVSTSSPSEVNINTRAIQEELGFRRPNEFRDVMLSKSRQGASEGISKYVSLGESYRKNPENTVVNEARRAGTYSVSTQIAVKPKSRPQINFSPPSTVQGEYSPPEVSVRADPRFDINMNFEPTGVSLARPSRVNISRVPVSGVRLNLSI